MRDDRKERLLKFISSSLFLLGMILSAWSIASPVPMERWMGLGTALTCAGLSASMLWNVSLFGIGGATTHPMRGTGLIFGFLALFCDRIHFGY